MTARARESLPPTFALCPGARAAPWVDSARPSWLGDVSQLTGQHKAGRPAALAERLTAQRLRSRAWLAEGLRLTKIHRRLAAQGVRIPYRSVGARDGGDDGAGRRAAIRRGGRGRFRPVRTVARSDDGTPGQVCGFLVTLGYSRYAFLWLCLRQQRLEQVGFEETATFEQIVWDSPVSFDRARVREPFSPHWLASSRTSIFCGPVGVVRPSSLTAPTRSRWMARASGPPGPRARRRASSEPTNRPLHGDSPRSKKGLAQATLMP